MMCSHAHIWIHTHVIPHCFPLASLTDGVGSGYSSPDSAAESASSAELPSCRRPLADAARCSAPGAGTSRSQTTTGLVLVSLSLSELNQSAGLCNTPDQGSDVRFKHVRNEPILTLTHTSLCVE